MSVYDAKSRWSAGLSINPVRRTSAGCEKQKARDFVPGLRTHTSLETDPGSAAHHFVLRCARDDAYGVT